ncbi:hypothetical protein ACIQVT_01950 [Streptomyces sp. NPDC100445]|uniref:hypothetical protein n=1 Tax=Streptomyces sp. NPDC100445 TaxID=3366102 RepID=UPI00382D5FB2
MDGVDCGRAPEAWRLGGGDRGVDVERLGPIEPKPLDPGEQAGPFDVAGHQRQYRRVQVTESVEGPDVEGERLDAEVERHVDVRSYFDCTSIFVGGTRLTKTGTPSTVSSFSLMAELTSVEHNREREVASVARLRIGPRSGRRPVRPVGDPRLNAFKN